MRLASGLFAPRCAARRLAIGCHVGNGPVVLREFERSSPGERASDDFWADAESWAESSKSPGARASS
jgi:hypothetical protein